MNAIRALWQRIFPPIHPLPAGMYTYQAPADAPSPYRLHLRLEPDGQGVLIVNASTVVRLNRTAAEYAYHLVKETPEEQAVDEIARRYNVRKEIVRRDYADLQGRLTELIDTPDLDPVTILNFDREDLYSGACAAPYRLDCALTYHLPDPASGHFAPQERVTRELSEDEWRRILDTAWQAGIPQVVFTGGEPTLRPDLCNLIAYAERLGMVTGLITNGLRLAERDILHQLLQSGLDHVMIVLDPADDAAWEALRATLAEDIAVTVHLTLTARTTAPLALTLGKLAGLGVRTISLSADAAHLEWLANARNTAAEQQFRLVWDLPVPYSRFHPVAMELAGKEDQPEGAGRAWLYVEPDGDVLPGQGRYDTPLGNLLADPWDVIWRKANDCAPAR